MISEQIIIKCINGNRRAQKRLYKTYTQKMFMHCYRYVSNKEDVEDILAEGFIKIFNNLNNIIVFDVSLVDNSIFKVFENVGFIQSIGFIAIIDSQKGDYSNLAIAYMLARDIAMNAKNVDLDKNLLSMIVNRIIKDINEITSIKRLVEGNIENNKSILKQLEKSILLMNFNQEYLIKFLNDDVLDKKDLLDFYMGEEVKDRYKLIEKEINEF